MATETKRINKKPPLLSSMRPSGNQFRNKLLIISIIVLVWFIGVSSLIAQSLTKSILAIKIDKPPQLDGKLDEPCWEMANPATGFIQKEPFMGKTATQQTVVYVLYDEENIYFGFHCFESAPSRIAASQTHRDSEVWLDDAVEIFLDTYHDHRNCYYFATNTLGAKLDGRVNDEGRIVDNKWDAHWKSVASIVEDGWELEIVIPFSEIRYKYEENPIWGINFYRIEKPNREDSYWVNTGEKIFAVSMFGHLIGIKFPRRSSHLEFTPYTAQRYQKYTQDPKSEYKIRIGVDTKVNLRSNLSGNITVNPDFAHIESDLDRFNLSYKKGEELWLPEKRPFFLEGLELLRTPFNLFYTRRMNEVKWGGKLTGKIMHTNIFLLDVQTKDTDENFSVCRIQRDIFKTGTIGILATDKEKHVGYSRALGIDATLSAIRSTQLNLQVAKSWTPATQENWAGHLSFNKVSHSFSLGGVYEYITADFDVEQGFISQYDKDKKGGSIWGELIYFRNRFFLRWMKTGGSYSKRYTNEGALAHDTKEGWVSILGKNKILLYISAMQSDEIYGIERYHNHSITVQIVTNVGEWRGYQFLYRTGEIYGSDMKQLIGNLFCTPINNMSIEIYNSYLTLDHNSKWINTLKLNYQFTKIFFSRIFLQSNTEEKTLNANILFGYEFFPGTIIYAAYNEARNYSENESKTDRIYFVKFTYRLKML